jgi:hypothetical protein
VTVPTCWYLLSNAPDNSHGHGDHGAHHSESHAEKKEKEPKVADMVEEKSEEAAEEKADDKASEKSEESSEAETKEVDTPVTSEDEVEKEGNTVERKPVEEVPADSKPAEETPAEEAVEEKVCYGLYPNRHSADYVKPTEQNAQSEEKQESEGTPEAAKTEETVNPK